MLIGRGLNILIFLSTLSLRRATSQNEIIAYDNGFLSTLSLRRATGNTGWKAPRHRHFYPRSPCGERHINGSVTTSDTEFLSTLSLRRATRLEPFYSTPRLHFYPRSPCGERHF